MGGSYGSSKGQSDSVAGSTPEEIMANYSKYLPDYLKMNTEQVQPFTRAIGDAGAEVTSGSGAQTASNISGLSDRLNPALSTSNTAAINANNTAIGANDAADSLVSAAQKGVGAVNLDGLSPGEAAAIERSTNQTNSSTGNLGLINPTNTIANAMNFGGAFNSKIPLYNSTVNNLASAVGAKTGVSGAFGNASNAATGTANATTGSNAGMNAIANPSSLAATSAMTNAGLLNNVAQGNFNQSISSNKSSNAGGGMNCCFIFLEAYKGKMPLCVRKGRDKVYSLNHDIATGYRRTAIWLVPLMKRFAIVRWLVWTLMVNPITLHLSHPRKSLNKRIAHFWVRTWSLMGKGKSESDYQMEHEYGI